MTERVIVYVDGFNLYYGLRDQGWRRYYWLNIKRLSEQLLKPGQQLISVKYFTSLVSPTLSDPDKNRRQVAYLDALRTMPDCHIIYGHYLRSMQKCRSCGATWEVQNEKMTDVNIATELMVDAFQDSFDTALVISGDSDLSGPIEAVHRLFSGKRVVVVFPPGRSSKRLMKVANAFITIRRNTLSQSQFPDQVNASAGIVIHRPKNWR